MGTAKDDEGWEPIHEDDGWEPIHDAGPAAVEHPAVTEARSKLTDGSKEEPGFLDSALDSAKGFGSTILHSGLKGFTKGGSDEAVGAITRARVTPGADVAWKEGGDHPRFLKTAGDAYRAGRDTEREVTESGAKRFPLTAAASQMAGDVGSDAVLQAFGVPVGSAAYQALAGALSGFLGSNSDLSHDNVTAKEAGGAALDTAIGGAIGYLAPKVGGAIMKSVPAKAINGFAMRQANRAADMGGGAIRDALEQFAGNRAMKAAGYIAKDLKSLAIKDPTLIPRRGLALLESGAIKPGRTVDDVAARLPDLVEAEGSKIGDILKTADKSGAKPFDIDPFIQKGKGMLAEIADDPARSADAAELKRLLTGYEGLQAAPIPFAKANALKSNLQGSINWNTAPKNSSDMTKALQHELLEQIDSQIGKASGPEAESAFRAAKQKYGALSDAEGKAREAVARKLGNRAPSPSDYLMGIGGLLSGASHGGLGAVAGAAGGAGLALGNKLLRDRGSSALAVSAYAASKAWPKALNYLVKESPETLGKFAPMLLRELQTNGQEGMAAMDAMLSEKEPEYARRKAALIGPEAEQ